MCDCKKNDNVRIMSFNIWGNCPKDTTISNRDDLEAVILLRYLPDSAGFQECSPKMRGQETNIFELISSEYDEVPAVATNEKQNNFTPIVYRRQTLKLLDYGWHYFVGLNDGGSKSITWALFERLDNGKQFIHINTHYFWKGTDAGRAARVTNTGEMLALMYDLYEKYPVPMFFTGDFNCRAYEPPIEVLCRYGLKDVRYTAVESSPWRSHHAYPTYNAETDTFAQGVHPSEEREQSIDHIFSYGDAVAEKFVTVVDSEALDASDHCPLYADFTF